MDNWSLELDLKIIGMTFLKVLKREGISEEGEATAAEFNPQISQIDADCPSHVKAPQYDLPDL